jgi:hypothetical protein
MKQSNKSFSYVPGELSARTMILCVVGFCIFDFFLYLVFSHQFAFSNSSQSAPQLNLDQKIESLRLQLSISEQQVTSLKGEIEAVKAVNGKTQLTPATKGRNGVSRHEFERLKCELRRLEQSCCQTQKPCNP